MSSLSSTHLLSLYLSISKFLLPGSDSILSTTPMAETNFGAGVANSMLVARMLSLVKLQLAFLSASSQTTAKRDMTSEEELALLFSNAIKRSLKPSYPILRAEWTQLLAPALAQAGGDATTTGGDATTIDYSSTVDVLCALASLTGVAEADRPTRRASTGSERRGSSGSERGGERGNYRDL